MNNDFALYSGAPIIVKDRKKYLVICRIENKLIVYHNTVASRSNAIEGTAILFRSSESSLYRYILSSGYSIYFLRGFICKKDNFISEGIFRTKVE